MKLQCIAAAALLSTGVSSSFALDEVLPPLNPSASFGNTVSGLFQDTFQFSVTGLSIVAVSITNSEINSSGESFGGILGFSGFIDLAVGSDIPLTYSTTPVPGPDGSTIHVQQLEGNGLLPIGTYTVVVEGTGSTGSNASYGGNVVAAQDKLQPIAAAALLSTGVSSSFALDEVLPPLNPSASFGNTVSGLFQDTFQFSVTGLSIVAVSITNSEINSSGESFGGILGFSGFIDLAVGSDIPLTYSTTPVPGPGGSTIHVQQLEGNGLLPIGTYTVVVEGTGTAGSNASYGGNVVAAQDVLFFDDFESGNVCSWSDNVGSGDICL